VDVRCSVKYQVIDNEAEFLNFLYGLKDREDLVRNASEWALRKAVSTRGIDSLLTVDREEVEEEIQHRFLQTRLDACESGVRVVDVNLESIHAPAPVHWAFRDVASAVEDQRQKENLAREYWERTTLGAEGEAAGVLSQADGEAFDRVKTAEGDGYAFTVLSRVYAQSPQVTEIRLYLEWVDRFLPVMNKYVDLMPGRNGREVWLRMGPESKQDAGTRMEEFELPWSREQEDGQ
jgi:membrane protease subunit HflK